VQLNRHRRSLISSMWAMFIICQPIITSQPCRDVYATPEPAESTPSGRLKKAQAAGIPDSLGEVRLVVEGSSTKILAQKRASHTSHKWDRAVSSLVAEPEPKLGLGRRDCNTHCNIASICTRCSHEAL
jgi:hypothetical protein